MGSENSTEAEATEERALEQEAEWCAAEVEQQQSAKDDALTGTPVDLEHAQRMITTLRWWFRHLDSVSDELLARANLLESEAETLSRRVIDLTADLARDGRRAEAAERFKLALRNLIGDWRLSAARASGERQAERALIADTIESAFIEAEKRAAGGA